MIHGIGMGSALAVFTACAVLAAPASAITASICIKNTLKGTLKFRAGTPCKASEIQIGSFDGTTIQFSGVNLQVVSGSGATDGTVNGTGNLIVGYNEATGGQARTGSHNLIVGNEHEYTSYGGLVAGTSNEVSGPYASVGGGISNEATGAYAAVSGGRANVASGDRSVVSGGYINVASGDFAVVSGGESNQASGDGSVVSGGDSNKTTGSHTAVSGGRSNEAAGDYASVSGGLSNYASGGAASVSGGHFNEAFGDLSSVNGGRCNVAGPKSPPTCSPLPGNQSVAGGFRNLASADLSTVGGGQTVTSSGVGEFHASQTSGFPTGTQY